MGKRANPAMVGAFVVGAVALVAVAATLLGSGRLFSHRHVYVLYFQSNVNGLRVDAPVKFHGVEIGSVYRIMLSLPQLERAVSAHNPAVMRVPVEIEVNERKIESRAGRALDLDDPRTLKRLIDAGLRGQLALESILTGLLYVELDMHPGTPANFVLRPNSTFQEIPTQPTEFEQVQQNVGKVLAKLSQIDFPAVVQSMVQMTDSIRGLVQSPQLQAMVDRLQKATKSLDAAAQSAQLMADTIRIQVVPLSRSLQGASENTAETMRQARAAMAAAQQAFVEAQSAFVEAKTILDPASPITYQLSKTLQDISGAARSTRELADFLQRNPSAIIRGRAVSQDRR
jgi:paraquat-inducible protein B